MKKAYAFALTLLFLVPLSTLWAQHEEEGPIMNNPTLIHANKSLKKPHTFTAKAAGNELDSSFIYTFDTISLPILDDFSTDKYQVRDADYSDPGVTSEVFYHLLDETTNQPLDTAEKFTALQTFRRTVDVGNAVYVDDPFEPEAVKVGDLSTYPVSYNTIDLYPPYYIYDTIDFPNDPDTVFLNSPEYVQDSIRIFTAQASGQDLYWQERETYRNYRFAKDPWTLGVATFDGLNEDGYPYEPGSTARNFSDHLTSKPIFMDAFSDADSVYLSFLAQPRGLGEEPEPGDSLILEFYAPEIDQWFHVWSMSGGPVQDFKVGHIRISDPKYFKDGFQFRFKSYGSMAGALDHFHLDYVHLRDQSGYQDTLFKDFAFVYPLNTLLKDYTSVPWDHYRNNPSGKMSDAVEIKVRNGSNLTENNQNGTTEILYQGSTEGTVTLLAQTLSGGDINYAPRTVYQSYHDFSASYQFDPSKPGNKAYFDVVSRATAPYPNLSVNDSTLTTQAFLNYYAYDDGSAERAYGPTGAQSMLAVEFEPYEADSLIAIDIHFVQSAVDVSEKLFFLTVWGDGGGKPGNVLYQDEGFFARQPSYYPDAGIFKRYYLQDNEKLLVSGKFYIGFRQVDPDRLNVGIDKNIDTRSKTFYALHGGNNWFHSQLEGSVMIHPVFSTSLNSELGIEDIAAAEPEVIVYPNPATDYVNVSVSNFEFTGMELHDLSGRTLLRSESPDMYLGDIPAGVYLITLNSYAGRTFKLIKN